EPAPATTGTRPLASSMHHSTTRLCSSWLRVGLSPVVPTGTSPWVPSAICQFTSARKAASSSEPFLKGVTRAVKEPLKRVLADINPSRAQVAAASVALKKQVIPGLAVRRKGAMPLFRVPITVLASLNQPRFRRGDGAKRDRSECILFILSAYSVKSH